jgi:DNA-binding NtrC family response regulator
MHPRRLARPKCRLAGRPGDGAERAFWRRISNIDMSTDTKIARVAPTRVTVLIDGGSSEERASVARALHDHSPRSAATFTVCDCATLEPQELERLLSTAVTASSPRGLGLGTLHIANVDAMALWQQPGFLGFLDGARRPRVVVSARVDLATAARAGRFWPPLQERLFLVRIALPPPH